MRTLRIIATLVPLLVIFAPAVASAHQKTVDEMLCPLGQIAYVSIVTDVAGKCLDAASKKAGANVQQWGCHGGKNQLWRFKPAGVAPTGVRLYQIIGIASGKVLDIEGVSKANGANLQIHHATGHKNQHFGVVAEGLGGFGRVGYFHIVAQHSNLCLGVACAGTQNGANIEQSTCAVDPKHVFRLEKHECVTGP